ncbi:MAG: ferritin-like domain-containing protein [Gammaproteobacteria bacterium]
MHATRTTPPPFPDPAPIGAQDAIALAAAALAEAEVDAKIARVNAIDAALQACALRVDPAAPIAAIDAGFPERPPCVPAREVPRRGLGTPAGRAAFLHALAHIEFNAVNLALDAACRFRGLPPQFHLDWLRVAAEEAVHFTLLRRHLNGLGHDYGDFPAHRGLWDTARETAGDLVARLALVPRVLEARGLDVTPAMIARLRVNADPQGAAVLERILADEIGHVRVATHWFRHACAERGLDPEATFIDLVARRMRSRLHGPLNLPARRAAGFSDRELLALQQVRA